jgi:hypothetical protein
MNVKTTIDEWELRDLEDNSTLRIYVEHCTELGNQSKPGIQIWYTVGGGTSIVTYEPPMVQRWAYQAKKAGTEVLLLEDRSWTYRDVRSSRIPLFWGTASKRGPKSR